LPQINVLSQISNERIRDMIKKFKVQGMSCTGCETIIENALAGLKVSAGYRLLFPTTR
jgi:hypothetical protein